MQRKQELETGTEQLGRAAAVMASAAALSTEYEKAQERHSALYPAVKAARDEYAVAEAALSEFGRNMTDGEHRVAAEKLEKARAAWRNAQNVLAHRQGVMPLARAVTAEVGQQGSGWAIAEAALLEKQQMAQLAASQAAQTPGFDGGMGGSNPYHLRSTTPTHMMRPGDDTPGHGPPAGDFGNGPPAPGPAPQSAAPAGKKPAGAKEGEGGVWSYLGF